MTPKERLESYSVCDNYREKEEDFREIEKALEVLEILKRHLVVETEDEERKELGESVNCYLKGWLRSDKEDYQKVKEWLERKGQAVAKGNEK